MNNSSKLLLHISPHGGGWGLWHLTQLKGPVQDLGVRNWIDTLQAGTEFDTHNYVLIGL